MSTINKWIVVISCLVFLFLINNLVGFKNEVEFQKNQIETLDSLAVDLRNRIQEDEFDIKECQMSYDDLLSEHNLVLDSLAKCRETLKFNPKHNRDGKSIQSKVSYNGGNDTRKRISY